MRKLTRWSKFVSRGLPQYACRLRLRDVVSNFEAHAGGPCHLGCGAENPSSLARISGQRSPRSYEMLVGRLLVCCQASGRKHRFRFKNELYSVDASTIKSLLPSFIQIAEGNVFEVNMFRGPDMTAAGSIVVFDRGYADYTWYKHHTGKGVYFVTGVKKSACCTVVNRCSVARKAKITSDQSMHLTGDEAEQSPVLLSRIDYRETGTRREYLLFYQRLLSVVQHNCGDRHKALANGAAEIFCIKSTT